jgi:quinol monooxygenase YgiN
MMMIRSVLRLKPKAGRHHDVVNLFERRRILARSLAIPGCLGGELGVAAPGNEEILATALWASYSAYEGWLASEGRANDVAELMPMLVDGPDAISPTAIFEIVLSDSPSTTE